MHICLRRYVNSAIILTGIWLKSRVLIIESFSVVRIYYGEKGVKYIDIDHVSNKDRV